jgi:DNA polymerase-3 subunit delta
MLLVEAHGASTTGALVKGFEAAGRAACVGFYDESAADLDTFARDLLARDGVRIETDAFTHLRAVLPEDRQALRQEIDKLSLYAADLDRPVSIEDLDALLGDAAALALDQALAEALSGRGAAAVETLERVISGSPISTLKALERRLLRLTEVRTRIDTGASAADAMKTLRPPPFFKERDALVAELRVWRANTLAKALDAVWRSETAAKRAGAPQDLLVAQCFREVAALVGGSAR